MQVLEVAGISGPWENSSFLENDRHNVSHVVGVLKIYYLLSCAGGWLSQHCCVLATAILYKSQ